MTVTGSDSNYSLTVPAGATLDLNPGTPEPASFLLFASGGVLLFLRKTRRA